MRVNEFSSRSLAVNKTFNYLNSVLAGSLVQQAPVQPTDSTKE
jgi:hypothetical protein